MTNSNSYFDIVKLSTDLLLLDPRNPRFLYEIQSYTKYKKLPACKEIISKQKSIKKNLEDNFKIEILVNSILSVGYLPIEPIIVVKTDCKKDANNNYYLVIEGNRRVTALKEIINDPGKIGTLPEKDQKNLNNIPCIILDSNDDKTMMNILGVRHLVAVEDWPLLQRAIMVGELYYEHKNDESKVADSFGITVREAKKLLRAISFYNWMLEEVGIELSSIQKKSFDIFTELITKTSIKNWIGYIEDPNNLLAPEFENLENAERLANWIANGILKSGRYDIRALAVLLTKSDKDSLVEEISDDNTPTMTLERVKAQEEVSDIVKMLENLKRSIKILEKIPASNLKSMSKANLKIIYDLRDTVAEIINIAKSIRGEK